MNERDTASSPLWSDDATWAASAIEFPILFLDGNHRLHVANPAARALADKLQPGSGPESLLQLVSEQDWAAAARKGTWRAIARPTPSSPLALEIHFGHAPDALRCIMVLVDISDRGERQRQFEQLQRTVDRLASTQEQLLQSEKMASIGQLAAGVAHEINNPIGYVGSNLGTLQDYSSALLTLLDKYQEALLSDDPSAHREAVQQARQVLDVDYIIGDLPNLLNESREGIERVTKIVQDLKDFSRVGRDQQMQPADLLQGLDSTLNIVWNDLKYKVRLEKHYTSLPQVDCLASEINQVFLNLLLNAGQAIEQRGTIVLASGCDEREVWISIADSGCGIPPEAMQYLFDPFYTTKPIGRGTGLGLAISYGIVSKHHGRIDVTSRVGQGTTFRVVLPIKQPVPDNAPEVSG
ncbi:ATP-binding protein [Thermomonas paludicola]|uniref:ATP-binding protein n=1 Tax=Thermomonas paludicola TaxID=2884874 RepID=UPI00211407DC|nr:ATP-binding protein [Thermomonas paludicola]